MPNGEVFVVDIVNLMLYFMCVEWNCHYFLFFICRILARSCVVCLCYQAM